MVAGVEDGVGDALPGLRDLFDMGGGGFEVVLPLALLLLGLLGELAKYLGGLLQRGRLGEEGGELFGLLDGGGAHQRRLAAAMGVRDGLDQREGLLVAGAEDLVVLIGPVDGTVGGDLHHVQAVDGGELLGFRGRGAGHAGELVVEAEQVLEGDRGQSHVLGLDLHLLLRLQRLVEAVAEAPSLHHAAGEFVDDDDLVVARDVVLILLEQHVRAQGLVDVVDEGDVLGVVEPGLVVQQARGGEALLDELVALVGEVGGALLLVDLVVLGAQAGDQGVHGAVGLGRVLGGAGDDEGGARLVDQDRVHLVHDGVGVAALGHVLQPELHVVPEVVEAELVVGGVGDVAGVGRAAGGVVEAGDDDAGGQAEEAVEPAHPFRVATGEVVVHRHHVDALPGDGVEIDRERGDERLALAGLHLGDAAFVQDHAADELHVEGPHPQRTLRALAGHGEGFRQQRVEALAFRVAAAELVGLRAQLVVREGGDGRLQVVDGPDGAHHSLDLAVVGGPEDLFGDSAQSKHVSPVSLVCGGAPAPSGLRALSIPPDPVGRWGAGTPLRRMTSARGAGRGPLAGSGRAP